MKLKKLLLYAILGLFILGQSACKKDNTSNDNSNEIETTFDLSSKQSISESLTDDVNNILNEVVIQENLQGSRIPQISQNNTCGAVTTSPGGFPKTITIDFGSGCSNIGSSVVRKGMIHVELTNYFRTTGSIATVTFDSFYVNGYKKEGTIKWTNTTTNPDTIKWDREAINVKITAPNNSNYWFHSGIKHIAQIEGSNTPNIRIDDVYSITGSSTTTNSSGISRNATIQIPLHKKVTWDHIDRGSILFQGPNHNALLDFGNGTDDAIATISVDGYTPRTITLP